MVAKKRKRRKKVSAESIGLEAREVVGGKIPPKVEALAQKVEADKGKVLAIYQEPLGGHWQIMAALPVQKVSPTSFQRDLSDAHVKRLSDKIERLNRFLDPITVVRTDDGKYLTPNGHHRTASLQRLGAKAIIAMVVPDFEIAYQILALNTEKAYNLKEKSLEAIRLARQLSEWEPKATEADYANQFEEPSFLTLGTCYEIKKSFPGGGYNPVLRKTEGFSDKAIGRCLPERMEKGKRLVALDAEVTAMVEKLKAKGLKSPYLKSFVIARINPLRFSPEKSADFDKTLDKMEAALKKMNPEKIEQKHIASMAFVPIEENDQT